MRKLRTRAEGGAVAVEFALILPVLLMILLGTIEFGRVYSQFQVYNGAAREGARCAAVQAGDFSDCDPAGEVIDAAGPYADKIPTGSILVSPAGGCTDGTIGTNVSVSWTQPIEISIAFWGVTTINPTIEAVFRCE